MLYLGIILKTIYRAKLIYDSAEYYPGIVANHAPHILYQIFRSLYLTLSKKADYILTTNEWTESMFKLINIKRTKVIPNVPNTDLFYFNDEKRGEIRNHLNIDKDTVIFSFVGYIGTYRGLENIVKAIDKLSKGRSDFKFLLIGRGPLKDEIVRMMRNKGLLKSLIIKDFIPLEKVPYYLSASDVVLSLYDPVELNNWYAVPNKLFEAAACSRAVIAGNFGYLKNLVLDMKCGLLTDPTNPKDIVDKMKQLINNPELREKLGKNGLKSIKKKYNLANISEKLEQMLEEIDEL
jgi:hypothetical protein